MRVMKDMNERIRGYGEPEIDAVGYRGMDVMKENGIGVCNNMSENVADEFNKINPEYNARVVVLYMNEGDIEGANIENNTINSADSRNNFHGNVTKRYYKGRLFSKEIDEGNRTIVYQYDEEGGMEKTIVETEENENYYKRIKYNDKGEKTYERIADKESDRALYYKNGKVEREVIIKDSHTLTIHYNKEGQEESREEEERGDANIFLSSKKSEKKLGIHTMVAIDIESDNATLLVDVTNLMLGVYKDGKMIMFNENKPNEAIYDRNYKLESLNYGVKKAFEYPMDYIKSFREPTLSMEELKEKYGLEAQNKMLEKIEREDEKENKQSRFKDDLKIDTGVTYNYNTNTVTIDTTKSQSNKQEERM